MEELNEDNWTYAELLDEDEVPTLLRIRFSRQLKINAKDSISFGNMNLRGRNACLPNTNLHE